MANFHCQTLTSCAALNPSDSESVSVARGSGCFILCYSSLDRAKGTAQQGHPTSSVSHINNSDNTLDSPHFSDEKFMQFGETQLNAIIRILRGSS